MRFTNKADNGYALDRQFNALNEYFIKSWIFKADQWLLLHQQHVVAVLLLMLSHQLTLPTASSSTSTEDVTDGNDVSDLLTSLQSKPTKAILQSPMFSYFQQVRASDEVFFPSILAMLQCLPSDEIACRRLTYCDWSGGEARPRSFPSLLEVDPQTSSEVLLKAWDDAKTQQSIFFRKCLLMAKNYRMDRNDVKLKAAVKLWFVEMSKSSQTTDIALIDNDFETTWQRITQELENEEQEIARLAKEQEELIRKEAEEERQRHAKRGRSRSESRDRSSHQRRRGRSESRNRREYRGSEPSRSHDEGRQQRQLQEHYSRQEGRRY